MTPQTQARRDLKAALGSALGTVKVFDHMPEKVSPPFVMVGPSFPYVDFAGMPFGGRRIHLAVIVVAGRGSNDAEVDALDELTEKVLAGVADTDDFIATEVGQPGPVPVNNQRHLGLAVEVITEV